MRDPRARRRPPAALTTDEPDEILAAALDDVQPLPADGPDRVRVRRPARPPAAPGPPARPLLHVERTGSRVAGWQGELPPRELATLGTAAVRSRPRSTSIVSPARRPASAS